MYGTATTKGWNFNTALHYGFFWKEKIRLQQEFLGQKFELHHPNMLVVSTMAIIGREGTVPSGHTGVRNRCGDPGIPCPTSLKSIIGAVPWVLVKIESKRWGVGLVGRRSWCVNMMAWVWSSDPMVQGGSETCPLLNICALWHVHTYTHRRLY